MTPMLLSEKDEEIALVRSIHSWSDEFSEQFLGMLGSFGFRRHEDTIEAPASDDWVIKRRKGTVFAAYPDHPLYNPSFTIFFRGRLVATIRVTVYRFSTAYAVEWNDKLIPRIRDYLSMREVDGHFPEFMPPVLEHLLM